MRSVQELQSAVAKATEELIQVTKLLSDTARRKRDVEKEIQGYKDAMLDALFAEAATRATGVKGK